MNNNLKPGYKTTEFWVTVAAIGTVIWSFAQQNCNLSPDKLLALALSVASAVYSGGRLYQKTRQ